MSVAANLSTYDPGGFYCELRGQRGAPSGHATELLARLNDMPLADLRRRAQEAENELYSLGITFTVYSNKDATDRILPFDIIPRILPADEWRQIESGVKQRVAALNLFLHDIYHSQKILKDGIVPRALVLGNANYRPEMADFDPPGGTYVHICGTDIVRDEA